MLNIKNRVFYERNKDSVPVVLFALNELKDARSKLPAGLRHRAKCMARDIATQIKPVDDSRVEICKEHGTFNEETKNYDFPNEEAGKAFMDAFNDLLDTEFQIPQEQITVDYSILDERDSDINVDAVDYLAEIGIVKIQE